MSPDVVALNVILTIMTQGLYKITAKNKNNPAAVPKSNECDGSQQHFASFRFFFYVLRIAVC